jgi:GH25 family lysozyme M1 (1,4-beta-N-acetylmuramidase)
MIPGLDVSNWQAEIDWSLVARCGQQFAFAKATQGTSYVDPYFQANWAGIKASGLARGAYMFADPAAGDPKPQVDFFLAHLGTLEVGDLLAVDLETGVGPLQDWTTTCLRYLESRAGFKPLLYSGNWFMRAHLLENNADLAPFGLWLAAYQTTFPAVPADWPFLAIWQYSPTGTVPGIARPCDLDLANVASPDQLRKYGKI